MGPNNSVRIYPSNTNQVSISINTTQYWCSIVLGMCVCAHSRFGRVRLFAMLWTVAHQAGTSISYVIHWNVLLYPPCLLTFLIFYTSKFFTINSGQFLKAQAFSLLILFVCHFAFSNNYYIFILVPILFISYAHYLFTIFSSTFISSLMSLTLWSIYF